MSFALGDAARLSGIQRRRCWRKERWKSLGAAKAQLRSLLRRDYVKEAELLNAYHCNICGGYHIGRLRTNISPPYPSN